MEWLEQYLVRLGAAMGRRGRRGVIGLDQPQVTLPGTTDEISRERLSELVSQAPRTGNFRG